MLRRQYLSVIRLAGGTQAQGLVEGKSEWLGLAAVEQQAGLPLKTGQGKNRACNKSDVQGAAARKASVQKQGVQCEGRARCGCTFNWGCGISCIYSDHGCGCGPCHGRSSLWRQQSAAATTKAGVVSQCVGSTCGASLRRLRPTLSLVGLGVRRVRLHLRRIMASLVASSWKRSTSFMS